MTIRLDGSWYGRRPRPRPHCVRWGPAPFCTLVIHWHPRKILRRSSQWNLYVGGRGVKRKKVARYSDFAHIEGCRKRLGKLVLITNRKPYMSFWLVSKSVTLNDLERHIMTLICVISPNSVASGAHCIMLKIYVNFLQQKCRPSPTQLVSSDISPTMI